ncbi:acyl-CoA dehydrogenase family protein [Microvirga antarctica]|uniref:acyl-CoA dehydrogenase family protein n=1 Tax=Microvirga antarctica TaxID=2819233 RepID=UPI001B314C93|nr:acyl-CoA dehydrogenase family protein [Microvirga antarctica]
MNFQHSEEQQRFRDSLRAALSRAGEDGAVAALSDLGVFGLTVTEAFGGSALGMVEGAIVLEEAGRSGLRYPLAETLLVAGTIVSDQPETVTQMLTGDLPVSVAVSGRLSRHRQRLAGSLTFADTRAAALYVASVDEHSLACLSQTITAPRIPRAAIEPDEQTFSVAIDVATSDAWVVTLPHHEKRLAILRCAELLGAAEQCFDLAIRYLKDRTQFGQAIGANQSLKHLAADNFLALENVRVSVDYAAAMMDAANAMVDDETMRREADTAVHVMLAYVPRATREIAEAAIQFHGGIGLTWEYPLNRYLRRIVRIGTMLGAVALHRHALLDLMCPEQANSSAMADAPQGWTTA